MPVQPNPGPVARNRARVGKREVPPPPTWTLDKVLNAVEQGRYFFLVMPNPTELNKYERAVYDKAVEVLGRPLSQQGDGGALNRSTYWPNKGGICLVINPPENPGPGVDVVTLALPPV